MSGQEVTEMSGSQMTALIILLAAIFLIGYWILVENPFTAAKIDFVRFFRAAIGGYESSSEVTEGRLPLGMIVFPLGSLAIWIVKRLLRA